jgi:hypothetical protein
VKKISEMEKEVLILKRKKAKELHEKGGSNRKIALYLLASKDILSARKNNIFFKTFK